MFRQLNFLLFFHNTWTFFILPIHFTVFFSLLVNLLFQVTMTPLPHSTPAPLNSLLDLNLNMNLNADMSVHDGMYNVKYNQPETLHEMMLFEPIRQIGVNHAMFEVTSFVDLRPFFKFFNHWKIT